MVFAVKLALICSMARYKLSINYEAAITLYGKRHDISPFTKNWASVANYKIPKGAQILIFPIKAHSYPNGASNDIF